MKMSEPMQTRLAYLKVMGMDVWIPKTKNPFDHSKLQAIAQTDTNVSKDTDIASKNDSGQNRVLQPSRTGTVEPECFSMAQGSIDKLGAHSATSISSNHNNLMTPTGFSSEVEPLISKVAQRIESLEVFNKAPLANKAAAPPLTENFFLQVAYSNECMVLVENDARVAYSHDGEELALLQAILKAAHFHAPLLWGTEPIQWPLSINITSDMSPTQYVNRVLQGYYDRMSLKALWLSGDQACYATGLMAVAPWGSCENNPAWHKVWKLPCLSHLMRDAALKKQLWQGMKHFLR